MPRLLGARVALDIRRASHAGRRGTSGPAEPLRRRFCGWRHALDAWIRGRLVRLAADLGASFFPRLCLWVHASWHAPSRQPSCTSALRHPSGARASAHGVGLGEYEAWHAEQVARLESGGDVNDMRFVLFQELSYTVGFGNQVALTKKSDTALGGDVQRPTCTHPPHQVEGLISALIYAVATRRILVVGSRQHTEAKNVSSQTWW